MLAKLKVYIIMFAAFALFAGAAYWYYMDTQKAFTELSTEFEEARQQVRDVEKLFEEGTDGRDLTVGDRAIENPEYIQGVLNTGTTELFRCFEILTGAPLGDKDAQAKFVKCSDDANSSSSTE